MSRHRPTAYGFTFAFVSLVGLILSANFLWAQDAEPPSKIFLAPDDHTDYFWTADDVTYRQACLEMLDYYLDQIDQTQDAPPEFQARWNCDGSLWLSSTFRIMSKTPLPHTTRSTLPRDADWIEIDNSIEANFDDVRTWDFDFNLTDPNVHHEEVGAILRAWLVDDGGALCETQRPLRLVVARPFRRHAEHRRRRHAGQRRLCLPPAGRKQHEQA